MVLAAISVSVLFNKPKPILKKQIPYEFITEETLTKYSLPNKVGIVGILEGGYLRIYYPKPLITRVTHILVVTVVDGKPISYQVYSVNSAICLCHFHIVDADGYNAAIFQYYNNVYFAPKEIYDRYFTTLYSSSPYKVLLDPSIIKPLRTTVIYRLQGLPFGLFKYFEHIPFINRHIRKPWRIIWIVEQTSKKVGK